MVTTMPDLDAAIREAIDNACSEIKGGDPNTFVAMAADEMRAALLAVLDLHAAPDRALPGEIHCGELMDWVQDGCPTVRAIAAALGVEADRG